MVGIEWFPSRNLALSLRKMTPLWTLTAAEALEEALCFGWIDGLIERIDEVTYRKYFSPRRKGSRWSERNKALVARLVDEHLITPKGLEVVERSRQDGTWDIVQDRSFPVERYAEFELLIWEKPESAGELQEDVQIHPATVLGTLL